MTVLPIADQKSMKQKQWKDNYMTQSLFESPKWYEALTLVERAGINTFHNLLLTTHLLYIQFNIKFL